MRSYLIVSLLLMMASFRPAFAQESASSFLKKVYTRGNDTLLYRILLPENFDPTKKYPVLLFLHGAGERGNDNEAQLLHGSKLFLSENVRRDFPAVVVFPQCPANDFWANVQIRMSGDRFGFQKGGKPGKAMTSLLGLVADLRALNYTDNDRFYVGGLSMGGMGTLELLRRKPKVFAAAVAICGGDNPENAKRYKRIPLWFFHGAKDNVVPLEKSEVVVNELKRLGAPVKFTVYPNDGHNSWDSAFREPDLLPWLFSNER